MTLRWSRDQSSYDFKDRNLSQLLKFRVHGSSADGDITYLICHITSHENFIKASYEIMGAVTILIGLVGALLGMYHHLEKFVGHRYYSGRDLMF